MQIDEYDKERLIERILRATHLGSNSSWVTRIEEIAESAGATRFDLNCLPWTTSPYLMTTFIVGHFADRDAIDKLTAELDRREQAQ